MDYKDLLIEIYDDENVSQNFEREYTTYLKKSIIEIDRLWNVNFEGFKKSNQKIKLVILGEAPMWGEKESYIYHPTAPDSSFFRLSHLGITIKDRNKRKPILLTELKKHGIIFLDVSPFPFNPELTSICYSKTNKYPNSKIINDDTYLEIIEETFKTHFKPKLDKILILNNNVIPVYCYRYKKLAKFEERIKELAGVYLRFPEILKDISSEGRGGFINKEKLETFLYHIK